MSPTDQPIETKIESLVADLRGRGSVLVAYSGGVDSAVVAALAFAALGERALAVTAAAETLAGRELDEARRVAGEIGVRHEVVTYSELSQPEFVANPKHRCYVCQGMRMDAMLALAAERGYAVVCDGTNASDPGPDRPGLAAVRERGIYSPLLAHGVDKAGRGRSRGRSGCRCGTGRPTPVSRRASRTGSSSPSASCGGSRRPRSCSPIKASA